MTSRRAFVTAAVRGVAFALVTALFTAVPLFHGYLWCVYIGFFLTMAFGVKLPEYPNYLCSLLVGYVWAFAYVFGHQWLEDWFAMPSLLALSLSELVLTFFAPLLSTCASSPAPGSTKSPPSLPPSPPSSPPAVSSTFLCARSPPSSASPWPPGRKCSSSGWLNNHKTTLPNRCRVVFFKNFSRRLDKFTWQWYRNYAKKTCHMKEAAP